MSKLFVTVIISAAKGLRVALMELGWVVMLLKTVIVPLKMG